jgi:hypothetical protein
MRIGRGRHSRLCGWFDSLITPVFLPIRTYDFEIGELKLRISSDIPRPFLKKKSFRLFFSNKNHPVDVECIFSEIPPSSLVLKPPEKEEKDFLSRFILYPQIGPESPLLKSPRVRSKLRKCLNHQEDISLEMHSESFSIFDFFHRKLMIYYLSSRKNSLESSTVGPGILAPFFPLFGGFMLHSSSSVLNNKAALFLAKDEGGKTTVMKNVAEGDVLSDDQNILKKETSAFFVHSTPWTTFPNGPRKARLGGLFLLEKAGEFSLSPINPVEMLAYLWAEHVGYTLFMPKKLRVTAFDLLQEACRSVPTYRMRFPKDYIDWDAVDRAMENG